MLQLLIKVPENTYFSDLPIALYERIKVIGGAITSDMCFNTRIFEGSKLVNFVCQDKSITLEQIERVFSPTDANLNWEIKAANDGTKTNEEHIRVTNTLRYYNYDEIINFIVRKKIYEEETFIRYDEPTFIELGKFAGMKDFEFI